jgi:hypothetical protein
VLAAYEEICLNMYQILERDYQDGIHWFSNWNNLVRIEDYQSFDLQIPIIIGADLLRLEVRQLLNRRCNGIYIARGYLGNHMYKTRQLWRYAVNGWANTKLLKIPYSRWNLMGLERHPWKVNEVKNVLIAPSKMTQPLWDPIQGWGWAEHMATQFPGADVKIRYKKGKSGLRWKSLFKDLDWADLVVAQGSAITAEAFWYGKKVLSTAPCITWAAQKNTLEDWQNPQEPKLRDLWHEHLAWSQFRNEEWESGEAVELIEKYLGPIDQYGFDHFYNFSK